jgi:membrane protein
MMFKWLPDAEVGWRDVWLGALVPGLLFEIGKFAIGFYIGNRDWNPASARRPSSWWC